MGEYRIDCTENQLVVKVDWIAVLTQSLEDEGIRFISCTKVG